MTRALPLVALIAVALLGCDRRVEPWVPPDQEPPPPDRPVRIPGLARPLPQAPDLEPSMDRGSRGALGAPPVPRPSGIRGQLRLAPGVSNPGRGVLFLIARSAGVSRGPPLLVKRLPPGPFPMPFELGPEDAMVQGRPLAGPLRLTARIDLDQDPLTREDAPAAEADGPVEIGASGVELVLR